MAVAVAAAAPAGAIIRRHDVDDARYIEFAKTYPQPVVLARAPKGASNGMGTFIAPDWIATAAHVTRGLRPGAELPGRKGVTIAEVTRHPEYNRIDHDIALVRLSGAVEGADVVPLCEAGDAPGTRVIFVGEGDTGTGETGPTSFDGEMRGAENLIDTVTDMHISFDFDAPEEALPLEGISGPGDSGGPAYVEMEPGVCLAGISSGQDPSPAGGKRGRYGVIEHYTRITAHREWIKGVLEGGE